MSERSYKYSLRLISDRQNLIGLTETRRQGLEPYMLDRTDMFWMDVTISEYFLKAEMSYSIDPWVREGEITWSISLQYGPKELATPKLLEQVRRQWEKSPEKTQAETWVRNLIEGGYFSRGRWPCKNGAECPHCGSYFEKGTSHPHIYLEDWNHKGEKRIIYHHKKMEKIIKERGLVELGISALPDIPSLEEKGELEPVTIQ